ncbi:DUF3413 domain-containing protein [Ancylomarina salipaludis]|uniref:DUF3413 domain-containing protein n=1 Tax=Ancylomarina salipaludis TaxID=2501299 RepID=A0A4Q1JJS7_9BACT|nr:DUF3413 domain-containing protein [Ancylomarina salipaludis]RXQ89065.1 DUF3413 domain-containing protein [Ancylomarina salipaludis]
MISFFKKPLTQWLIGFSIFNSLLFILFSFRYSAYIDFTHGIWQWLYIGTTTIGHVGAIALIVMMLPLLFLIPFRNQKFILILSSLLNTIGLIFFTVDSFIFSQYRFHLNKFVLDMLFSGAAGDIFQFSGLMYSLAIGSVLFILALEFVVGNWMWNKKIFLKFKQKSILLILLGLVLTSHLGHAYASATSYSPITKNAHVYPLYFPLTANGLFKKFNLINPDVLAKNKVIKKNSDLRNMKYPAHKLQFEKGKQYNILFVVVDCWRADCLDSLVTPNISEYANKALLFKNHQSGSCGTRGGIFSLFYGLPSFAYWNTMKANCRRPVLMQTLAEQNYKFGIFASSNLTHPAFHQTVFADINRLRIKTNSENSAPYARDAKITEEWLAFIDSNYTKPNDQPFFGFLFYDSAHGYSHPNPTQAPFQPSWTTPNYLILDNNTDPRPFFNLYKNTLNYVDSLVGKVLVDLDRRQLLDNTIVVLTGDHAQEFNDNKKNYWGHGSNFSDAQTHVPLAVLWPGMNPQVFTHKSLHYDIASTLLNYNQGCLNPADDFSIGKCLWETSSPEWFVAGADQNYAIIENNQITTTLYGSYSVTTPDMNALDNNKLHSNIVFEAMKASYKFYTN